MRTPRRVLPIRRLGWISAGALLGLTGCLETSLVGSVLFAPRIAGLSSDAPWVPLPVSAWVTDERIEVRSIEACFDPGCPERAAIGLFRARGREAETLSRAAADPAQLVRYLTGQGRQMRRNAKRPQAVAAAERVVAGAWTGFSLRLSRPDGSRPAHAVALLRRSGDALTVVLVVVETGGAARRIADEVAAAQPG